MPRTSEGPGSRLSFRGLSTHDSRAGYREQEQKERTSPSLPQGRPVFLVRRSTRQPYAVCIGHNVVVLSKPSGSQHSPSRKSSLRQRVSSRFSLILKISQNQMTTYASCLAPRDPSISLISHRRRSLAGSRRRQNQHLGRMGKHSACSGQWDP